VHNQNNSVVNVIINADDFGYSHEVNQVILESIEKAVISSTTIMANAPAVQEALQIASSHPQVSYGIHLNLTEFQPLLANADLKSTGLVDASGNFIGNGFRQLRPTPKLLQACYEELSLQMQSLLERGLKPTHLDSHHHIHTVPWLLPVISGLQRRFKLFKLRNTMNVYDLDIPYLPSKKLLTAKQIWQLSTRLLGSKMTQRFTSLRIFLTDPFRTEFTAASSIELMCHPGQVGFEQETKDLLNGSDITTRLLLNRLSAVSYSSYSENAWIGIFRLLSLTILQSSQLMLTCYHINPGM
jgi:predicted glycoside hydrolase/deacetylase ChbG (UPF0249 family)